MLDDYVRFETAKLLKEKGFGWVCFQYWHEGDNELVHSQSMHPIQNISNPCFFGPAAPTLQMAMKWLREVHNIFIEISVDEMLKDNGYQWALYYNSIKEIMPYANWEKSYEEACEAAIKYCLENLI